MIKEAVFALATATAVALSSAAPAGATPSQDQTFYNILLNNRIQPGSMAVYNARVICREVWAGNATVWDAVDNVYENNDLSYNQAKIFVAAAIEVYCPPNRNTT